MSGTARPAKSDISPWTLNSVGRWIVVPRSVAAVTDAGATRGDARTDAGATGPGTRSPLLAMGGAPLWVGGLRDRDPFFFCVMDSSLVGRQTARDALI
jgi:hypothetical protein